MISEVAIGNLMKGAEMLAFMAQSTLSAVGCTAVRRCLVVENLDGPARQHAVVARGDDALAGDRPCSTSAWPPSIRLTLTSRSSALDVGRDDIGVEAVGAALHGRVGNHNHIVQGLDAAGAS